VIDMNKEKAKACRFIGLLVGTLLLFLTMSYLALHWKVYGTITVLWFGVLSYYYVKVDNYVEE